MTTPNPQGGGGDLALPAAASLDGISATRGTTLYRGASSWAGLAPSTAGNLLKSGGAGADPSFISPTAMLDAAFGSTRGATLIRGASGWTVLAPGTATHVLTSNGVGADPSYQAAGGGGGGSFDPAAATAITFTTGISGNSVTGPTDTDTRLGTPSTATFCRDLILQPGSTTGVTDSDYAGSLFFYGGNAPTDGVSEAYGGYISFVAGGGGNPGNVTFAAGNSYFAGVAAGSLTFTSGTPADGDSGGQSFTIPDAVGTNRSGGVFSFQLGAKTGSGAESSLVVRGASGSDVFKVAYDGKITVQNGPTISSGTSSPEGVVTAPVGSLFFRTDGGASTTLYVKTGGAGNTGWTAK